MKIEWLPLSGAALIETEPHKDQRGIFARLFCQNELVACHHNRSIEQINLSITHAQGVVRGLHYQYPPHAEDKIVRCLHGRVFDVMVDLRKGSTTYGRWHAVELDGEEMNMMYIPRGFAHGFQTLTDNCEMLYLHSQFYSSEHEGGIHYNSPALGIQWPLPVSDTSQRDEALLPFNQDFQGIEL